jgi:hypothetical protein
MLGGIPGSVLSPPGKGAPGIPCLRGPPGTPARVGAPPAAGPEHGVVWPRPSRAPGPPLEGDWGGAERGGGRPPPAPSTRPWASSTPHTGDRGREVKARGQEAREPPTKRPGPPAASEGASEAEPGQAVPPRRRTAGAGPAPLGSRRTQRRQRPQDPANAPAVPCWEGRLAQEAAAQRQAAVKAVARATEASWCWRWRVTEGVAPCAVQAARTVRNGGDEETYRKATRLVPTQPRFPRRLQRGVRLQQHSMETA